MAPGSCLIATIASGKGSPAGQFYQTYNASGFATMYNHTSADFASFFDDLEIIPPGLCGQRSRKQDRPSAHPDDGAWQPASASNLETGRGDDVERML